MPNDDLTATTPGVSCAAWPSDPVLPLQDGDKPDPNQDHAHGSRPRRLCNGRLRVADSTKAALEYLLGSVDAYAVNARAAFTSGDFDQLSELADGLEHAAGKARHTAGPARPTLRQQLTTRLQDAQAAQERADDPVRKSRLDGKVAAYREALTLLEAA